MKLVLDTNIYCNYAEGIPDAVDIIAKNIKSIYIPSVVIGELLYGSRGVVNYPRQAF